MGYLPKKKYHVFVRSWWLPDSSAPDGRKPGPGSKTTLGYTETEEEAREMCREYNSTHEPGKLSIKAEYTQYN